MSVSIVMECFAFSFIGFNYMQSWEYLDNMKKEDEKF